MSFEKFSIITLPRQAQQQTRHQRDQEESAILARWLATTEQARKDATGRQHWQMYSNPVFAELWYTARDAANG